jgi:pseudouridine-5'-phosphate glycosidase
MSKAAPLITIGEEVASALAERRPIVALESTIITHGLPYPENLMMARAVEDVVRARGATPATIALVDGVATVGLSDDVIERLANDRSAFKASSRDLSTVMVRGLSAGTTVSATMLLAERAGIRVFATGGVGGVHRGAEHTFDISADLVELGRTPTAVVCAGVKSILDIPKTLEFLETQRVPVIAFGTDEFPAFYTPHSGQKAGLRLDTPEDLARAIALHHRLGAGTGLLIANPIPPDDALDAAAMESTIRSAVAEADRLGIGGKELTPVLLAKINELTKGASLGANIALVKNNADLAARIAVALAAL